MSLKIYHFVCYTLHHWLEVFKSPQNILGLLSETQKCRFFSLENKLLLCSCGDGRVHSDDLSPCLSPGLASSGNAR